VAVEDIPPGRHDPDRADAVVFREREVVLAAQDLRVPVRRREQGEDRPDDDSRGLDAEQKPPPIFANPQHVGLRKPEIGNRKSEIEGDPAGASRFPISD
jgi:hypothetical protein